MGKELFMENLAPNLKRQRLLVEGFLGGDVDEARVKGYFKHLCKKMGFQAYGEPIIHSPMDSAKKKTKVMMRFFH